MHLTSFCLLLCVAVVGLSSASADEHPQGGMPRTIQVSGTGRAASAPDIASFEAAVVTEAASAGTALEANSAGVRKVMETLKTLGIADKDLQTSRFDVGPRYTSTPQKPEPVISGYTATNQVHVRVRNLPQLGKVLDAVIQSGSNQVSNIHFGVDNEAGLKNEARNAALADAKARAMLYAHGVGGKVGKVLSIREQESPEFRPPMPFAMKAMMASDGAVPVATGEQHLDVTIHVTYELVD